MRTCAPPVLLLALVAAGGSALPQSAPGNEAADGAAFKKVCGACHAISLVKGLRTETEWLDEVEQMIKIGAKGTDEELDAVIRVLLRTLTKVNVNNATAPEIAPVLDISDDAAEALVKRREEAGGFRSLDDLKKLPGLSAAKLEARKDRIVF